MKGGALVSPEEVLELRKAQQLELLAEVSSLYYEHGMTQEEIARGLFVSRSRVSRLLTMAREQGIVTFNIKHFGERCFEFEQIIKRKYQLEDVFILNSDGHDEAQMRILMERHDIKQLKPAKLGIVANRLAKPSLAETSPIFNLEAVRRDFGKPSYQHPQDWHDGRKFGARDLFNAVDGTPVHPSRQRRSPRPIKPGADLVMTGIMAKQRHAQLPFHDYRIGVSAPEERDSGFICGQADIEATLLPRINQRVVSLTEGNAQESCRFPACKGAAILGAGCIVDVLEPDLACTRDYQTERNDCPNGSRLRKRKAE